MKKLIIALMLVSIGKIGWCPKDIEKSFPEFTIDECLKEKVNTCPKCKSYELDKFCINCGLKQGNYIYLNYCLQCKVFNSGKYCSNCGKKLIYKRVKR